MPDIKLTVSCDTNELDAEILSSIELFNRLPELFNLHFDHIDSFFEFICLNIDSTTTSRANDLRVSFKMSDGFREFMRTLRATEIK